MHEQLLRPGMGTLSVSKFQTGFRLRYHRLQAPGIQTGFQRDIPTMTFSRAFTVVLSVAVLLQFLAALVSAQRPDTNSRWRTLSGDPPVVIAHGGLSGMFPDSSDIAYLRAGLISLPNVIMWCDVQLTKDEAGICFPDLMLNNASNADMVFPKGNKSYNKSYVVNGVHREGWFSVDCTLKELSNVNLTQAISKRPPDVDFKAHPIMTVEAVAQITPSGLWLNIQHDMFYMQQNLSMRRFILSLSRRVVISFISSPEVAFLRSISSHFRRSATKLVFRFLEQEDIEPSTNQAYGALLGNLTFIKTFASGILVPKSYIWPVDEDLCLQPYTSLVQDAHREGLKIFASDFESDTLLPYNYSFDPLAEYLYFIDNGVFSVDGVLSSFPITPSAAIDCFSHLDSKEQEQVDLLVISRCGASGDFPGCTDYAYRKAIADGVDILDCTVQMSKDGIPFCMRTINLGESTTIVDSLYVNLSTSVPEVDVDNGIPTFSLTWSQIKSLKAAIWSPWGGVDPPLLRNPNNKNAGSFLTVPQFLALTKNSSSLKGILISIQHAEYLAKNKGLGVVDAVLDALRNAGYNNQTAQRVMIQSTNSSVLEKFKEKSHYELVYTIDDDKIEVIRDSAAQDIKTFASSVVVRKTSVFNKTIGWVSGMTNVVAKLHSFKLHVYVQTFMNEYLSSTWDSLCDPTVEINMYYQLARINGVITDFPMTAARYRGNRCLSRGAKTPSYMQPITLCYLLTGKPCIPPPVWGPTPALTDSDVAEPPLPNVTSKAFGSSPKIAPVGSRQTNAQPVAAALSLFVIVVATFVAVLLPSSAL